METEEEIFGDPASKLVLIVDDDAALLELMDHAVRDAGFRTDRAVDGPSAVKKIEALEPDLIVLDMMLPGMGGYEVVRQMQAVGCGRIPVVIVTGRQMDRQAVGLIRQEPNIKEFLEKPVRPANLVLILHRLLRTQPSDSSLRERSQGD